MTWVMSGPSARLLMEVCLVIRLFLILLCLILADVILFNIILQVFLIARMPQYKFLMMSVTNPRNTFIIQLFLIMFLRTLLQA